MSIKDKLYKKSIKSPFFEVALQGTTRDVRITHGVAMGYGDNPLSGFKNNPVYPVSLFEILCLKELEARIFEK
jgi:hypothetical protein